MGQVDPQVGLMTQQQEPPMTLQPGQFNDLNTTIVTQQSVLPGTEYITEKGMIRTRLKFYCN